MTFSDTSAGHRAFGCRGRLFSFASNVNRPRHAATGRANPRGAGASFHKRNPVPTRDLGPAAS